MAIEFDVKGHTVFVDEIDSDLITLNWHYHKSSNETQGYIRINRWVNGKKSKCVTKSLHRTVYERIAGRPLLTSERVDHKDGNPLNNQRSNLRLATASQNSANRAKAKNNTTGYKGVYRHKNNWWRAIIQVQGEAIHLGLFRTPEEAHEAYKQAAVKYFGEFARFK